MSSSNIANNSNPKTLSIFFNEFNIISFKKRIVLKGKNNFNYI